MFSRLKYKRKLSQYRKISFSLSKQDKLCYAPYTTMVFTQDGNIMPCYYNKQISFGKYYHGIDYLKLWKNNQFGKLRESIDRQNLDFGCHACKEGILNQNYNSVYARKYYYLKDHTNEHQPVSLQFQISNKCNFRCIMCAGENSCKIRKIQEEKADFDSAYDNDFPQSLTPLYPKLKELSFAGGEPFLIKEYREIIKLARNANPNINYSFGTNGSLFTKEDFDFFENEDVQLTISYESTKKDVFETIRKGSKFEIVHYNLIKANDILLNKNKTLNVKICPLQQNIFDIPETFLFLNSLNINISFNTVLFPPSVALWVLSSSKLYEIVKYLSNIKLPTAKNEVQKLNNHTFLYLIKQIEIWQKTSMNREAYFSKNELIFQNELSKYYKRINDYIKNWEISLYSSRNIDITANLIDLIDDEATRMNTIIFFNFVPIYWLVSEMNFRGEDKWTDRVQQVIKDISNNGISFYE